MTLVEKKAWVQLWQGSKWHLNERKRYQTNPLARKSMTEVSSSTSSSLASSKASTASIASTQSSGNSTTEMSVASSAFSVAADAIVAKPSTAPATTCRKRHSLALTMRLSACLDAFTSTKEQPKQLLAPGSSPTTSSPTAAETATAAALVSTSSTKEDPWSTQRQPHYSTTSASASSTASSILATASTVFTSKKATARHVHFAIGDQLTRTIERSTTSPTEKAQYHYSRRELQELLADARKEADMFAMALMTGPSVTSSNNNHSVLTGYGNAIASYQPEGTIMQQGFLFCAEKSGFFHPHKRFYCLFKSDRSFAMYASVQDASDREHLKEHFLVTQVQDFFTSSISTAQDRKSFMLVKINGDVLHFEAENPQTKQQWIRALVKLVGNVHLVPFPSVAAGSSSSPKATSHATSNTCISTSPGGISSTNASKQLPSAISTPPPTLVMTLQPLRTTKPTVWQARQQHQLVLTKPLAGAPHASLVQGASRVYRNHATNDNNSHSASAVDTKEEEEVPHHEVDHGTKVVV